MRARVTCAWLFVSAAACTPGSGGGGLPARYAFLGQSVLSSERAAELRGELPYERIELEEYNPWIWGGDRIELSADGSAEWLDAGRGRYAGEASIYDYGHLCYLLEVLRIEELDGRYAHEGVFDATTVTLRVWRRGAAEPFVVESYAGAAPLAFRTVALALDGVVQRVRWEPAPSADEPHSEEAGEPSTGDAPPR